MGFPVLILGETGSGKTYSIKNFDTEEVGIFSVEKNRLPFKKAFKIAKNATYQQITNAVLKGTDSYCITKSNTSPPVPQPKQ